MHEGHEDHEPAEEINPDDQHERFSPQEFANRLPAGQFGVWRRHLITIRP